MSPWQMHLVAGHTFPHHILRTWYSRHDIAMDTATVEDMYKTLCLLHAGRQAQVEQNMVGAPQALPRYTSSSLSVILQALPRYTSSSLSVILQAFPVFHVQQSLSGITGLSSLSHLAISQWYYRPYQSFTSNSLSVVLQALPRLHIYQSLSDTTGLAQSFTSTSLSVVLQALPSLLHLAISQWYYRPYPVFYIYQSLSDITGLSSLLHLPVSQWYYRPFQSYIYQSFSDITCLSSLSHLAISQWYYRPFQFFTSTSFSVILQALPSLHIYQSLSGIGNQRRRRYVSNVSRLKSLFVHCLAH